MSKLKKYSDGVGVKKAAEKMEIDQASFLDKAEFILCLVHPPHPHPPTTDSQHVYMCNCAHIDMF